MGVTSSRVSLSKSALLLSPCVAWAGPGSQWYEEDKVDAEDLSKRDKGTLFHARIASGTNCDVSDCPEDVQGWYRRAALFVDNWLIPRCESYQTEVAIAVNWSTGDARALCGVADRNYPDMPGYQFGTADIVCVLKDGTLLIADWKTGGNEGAEEQLTSLACAFQKACPEIGSIDGQMQWERPRKVRILCLQVNDDGVWPHESDVSQEQLDSHWDSMRFQWEDVLDGKRSNPVTGIHCTTLYCPHLAYCRGIGQAVADLARKEEGVPKTGPLVPPLALNRANRVSPAAFSGDLEAGDAAAIISAAKRQVKYTEAKLKEHIANGGRVISGNWEWSDGNNGFRWRRQ